VKVALINRIKILNVKSLARLILLYLIAFASVSAVQASDRVQVPAGEARQPAVADIGPHAATSGSFNERWSYLVALDNGTHIHLNLSLARLGGFREPTAGADLSLLGFNGQDYFVAREYPVATRFRYDASGPRLEVHPEIFFEGAPPRRHRLRFATEKDGTAYEIDLSFSEMAPGMTWGDGVFALGSERLWMAIHIPYARVSGTVRVDGVRQQVRGTAYMDHSYQTTYAPRLIRAAYRVVRHTGSGWEAGYYLLPASRFEDRPVGFGMRSSGGRVTLLRPRAVEAVNTRRTLGADVPGQLRVAFTDGSETILTRRRDRQARSALADLTAIERTVVRRVLGGEVINYRGSGSLGTGESATYDFLLIR